MTLRADIEVRLGDFELDVDVRFEPDEVVAVLGPNGSGKSTLLRCLAGLHAVDAGRITIDDEVLDDPTDDVFVGAEHRRVGVVFQDYLLFDHLSALDNVAFGPRARGVRRSEANEAATAMLRRLGLADRASSRPGDLSGGQAQRVALARALAVEPRVLLLDEPLAALDVGTRAEVRRSLRRTLREVTATCVLVTHDPVDAYALADRVVILEGGRVVQSGSIAEVTAHPTSRYVADLVGTNLVVGVVTDGVLTVPGGARVTVSGAADGPSFAVIRPQAVTLSLDLEHGTSARNSWRGSVAEIERIGDRARVTVDGALSLTAEITVASLEALALAPGDGVYCTVKATDIVAYPT